MALLQTVTCNKCGETNRQEYHTFSRRGNVCADCWAKEEERKKRVYLASLKGLTLEERLEKIEETLYNLNVEDRFAYLESFHRTYA
jgi:hypothetical protein